MVGNVKKFVPLSVSCISFLFKSVELTLALTLTHADFRATAFFLGKCRGNCSGVGMVSLPRIEPLHVLGNSCGHRGFSGQSPRIGRFSWQRPRTAAEGRGNCFGWTSVETAVASVADFRGNCRVAVAMTADICGNYHGSFRRKFRGHCRVLPCVAMVGTTVFSTGRTAARAAATTVNFAVNVP